MIAWWWPDGSGLCCVFERPLFGIFLSHLPVLGSTLRMVVVGGGGGFNDDVVVDDDAPCDADERELILFSSASLIFNNRTNTHEWVALPRPE